jgi:hypothetical protein
MELLVLLLKSKFTAVREIDYVLANKGTSRKDKLVFLQTPFPSAEARENLLLLPIYRETEHIYL